MTTSSQESWEHGNFSAQEYPEKLFFIMKSTILQGMEVRFSGSSSPWSLLPCLGLLGITLPVHQLSGIKALCKERLQTLASTNSAIWTNISHMFSSHWFHSFDPQALRYVPSVYWMSSILSAMHSSKSQWAALLCLTVCEVPFISKAPLIFFYQFLTFL